MKEMRRSGVSLREWLDEELTDPEFRQLYDEAAIKWHVAMQITEARQKANLTQGELAHQIGDRQQNVSRIESGAQNVTIGTLGKIAKAVGGHLVIQIVADKPGTASAGSGPGILRDSGNEPPYRTKSRKSKKPRTPRQ